jgi:hypothetical protein
MVSINYPSASGGGDWLPIVVPVYLLVWLGVLGAILIRKDFDPVTRLTWVLVVILVPVAGLLLYLFLAPARELKTHGQYRDGSNSLSGTPWENNPGHTHHRSE